MTESVAIDARSEGLAFDGVQQLRQSFDTGAKIFAVAVVVSGFDGDIAAARRYCRWYRR